MTAFQTKVTKFREIDYDANSHHIYSVKTKKRKTQNMNSVFEEDKIAVDNRFGK